MQVTQDFESSILEMDKENSFDLHNRATSVRPSVGAKREAGVLQDISNEEDQCTQCTCGRSVKRSTFQHSKICNLFNQQHIKKPLARCVSRTPPFAAAKSNLKALQRAAHPPPSPSLSLNWTPDTSFAQSPLRHNAEEQDDHDTVTESMSQYDEDRIESEEEEEEEEPDDGDGEANFTPDAVRVSGRSGEKAARKSLRCASPMVILSYRSDSEDEEAESEAEPELESEFESEAEAEPEPESEFNARGNTGKAVEEEEEELFLSQTSSEIDESAEAGEDEQAEVSIIFEDDGHPLEIAIAEEEAAREDEAFVVQRLPADAEAEAEKQEGTDETAPGTHQQRQIGEEEEEEEDRVVADAADDNADALLVLLRALRLDHHHARFVEEEVSLGDVLLLTDEELERHLGLRLGPRRRLRHAIAQLALPPAFPSSAARRVQDTLDRVANVGHTETSSLLRE
ncbi:SAM domain (Sterile alpha motif) domain containing protein [Acanthamoeba castellanii str. Neff]|uniref:SAM domain (Sterile alpha motif) domain containing protein n=1 Tax=Acanthamoeba castellanii (strain ATCC 30010 / Neff) TaxID=1257118 RepID=L8H5S1_ACACF|nr:SAM domain (Sterile alpha motif) domain containing protein [Acanthamoeba castellanii str. Neff]ELR19821.1 SAM domain (Sterile alpha motif) domain containing protein [Acanthamoeba castellanii str. Neff]